jgi:hypothetical protein
VGVNWSTDIDQTPATAEGAVPPILLDFSAAPGFILGGRAGIICGVIGLLIGGGWLAWIIASSAKHDEPGEVGSAEAYSAQEETKILMLVRDAHARALPESDSDFDIFLNVWVTSETEFDVGIKEFQLTITASKGNAKPAERISGDLDKWRVGKEREESDMWDTYVQTSRENLAELNTTDPLRVGIPREGWLHFRLRNLAPEEFRSQPMGLSLTDSLSHVHVALVTCPRHLPGKVWPRRGRMASV